jgi:hypothetical protein
MAVCIVTGYGLDNWKVRVRVPVGTITSYTPHCPDWLWGPTLRPIQWVTGALSPGVKRPESEADHPPSTTVEIKKTWIYTSTPHPASWRNAYLVKHRDKFTFSRKVHRLLVISNRDEQFSSLAPSELPIICSGFNVFILFWNILRENFKSRVKITLNRQRMI